MILINYQLKKFDSLWIFHKKKNVSTISFFLCPLYLSGFLGSFFLKGRFLNWKSFLVSFLSLLSLFLFVSFSFPSGLSFATAELLDSATENDVKLCSVITFWLAKKLKEESNDDDWMLRRFLTVDWPSEDIYEVSSLLMNDSFNKFDFVSGFNVDWWSKAFCLSILKTFSLTL